MTLFSKHILSIASLALLMGASLQHPLFSSEDLIEHKGSKKQTSSQKFVKNTQKKAPSRARLYQKTRIYLQDPSLNSEEGEKFKEVVFTTMPLRPGPGNQVMKLDEKYQISPDKNGNFLYKSETKEFDAIHTISIVKLVFDMYGWNLQELAQAYEEHTLVQSANQDWVTQNQFKVLQIEPFDTSEINKAYYARTDNQNRGLCFSPFQTKNARGFTCRSLGIVAHQAGHATLDVIQPSFWSSQSLQTAVLHEVFSNLTALFLTLNTPTLTDVIVEATKGNLHQTGFFPSMVKYLGGPLEDKEGVQNLTLQQADPEVHSLSHLISTACYDYLAEKINTQLDTLYPKYQNNLGILLFDVGHALRKSHILSIVEIKKKSPSIEDWIKSFITVEKRLAQRNSNLEFNSEDLLISFENRGLLGGDSKNFYKKLNKKRIKAGPNLCQTPQKKITEKVRLS